MKTYVLAIIFGIFFLSGCDKLGSGDNPVGLTWTRMTGSSSPGQPGTYGTKGVPSPSNVPGARVRGATWVDPSTGDLMLFGGSGLSAGRGESTLGDLWKFDGTNWTWVNGSNTGTQPGAYGSPGEKSLSNLPGSRAGAAFAQDANGNLYLFGGLGHDGGGSHGYLNDLWKYDGTYWIWISGTISANQATIGTAPGGREDAALYIDGGNVWLFGGMGYDQRGGLGELNDLWKFDGTNWTQMKGSSLRNQSGSYGTPGSGAAPNTPGSRHGAFYWKDASGRFFVAGGQGYSSQTSSGYLSDIWKYDGTNWTFVAGATTGNTASTYSGSTAPGGRSHSAAFFRKGNFYLFGGTGFGEKVTSGNTTTAAFGAMGDFWSLSGSSWRYVAGPKIPSQVGDDGFPGSRAQAMTWVKNDSTLYLFGGSGVTARSSGLLNDLWRN